MIYEHKAGKHHVFIEWNRYGHWGENGETKWAANCQGLTLTQGPTAQDVLASLVEGRAHQTLDGTSPAEMGLPGNLDAWATDRL